MDRTQIALAVLALGVTDAATSTTLMVEILAVLPELLLWIVTVVAKEVYIPWRELLIEL